MRISDWSSDVCSSDLKVQLGAALIITLPAAKQLVALRQTVRGRVLVDDDVVEAETLDVAQRLHREGLKRLGAIRIVDDFRVGTRRGDAGVETVVGRDEVRDGRPLGIGRSDEHTTELKPLVRNSYADCRV